MTSTKSKLLALAAALTLGASAYALTMPAAPAQPDVASTQADTAVTQADVAPVGDYLEARTAAVFAGACHYNGEVVTTGRDALMAWSFTGGTRNGVSLAGVRVVAAVTSTKNLIDAAPHRTQLVVDSAASTEQADAVVALLREKLGSTLGTVVEVRRASVSFDKDETGYAVNAADFASLRVKYLTDDSCCLQPGDVWYEPLAPLQGRKVGYTEAASFTGEGFTPWHRSDENSAFYGSFRF